MSARRGGRLPLTTSPMPWDFVQLMDTVVLVEHQVGNNVNSEPTFAPAIAVRCRIQNANDEVRTADGLDRVAKMKIILAGIYGVEPQDRVTLPDGSHPVILSTNQSSDGTGSLYEEILT